MGIDVVVLARFLLTGIALLLAFLATVTWSRRRDAPEAGTFAVLVALMAVYSFGYAGELAQTSVVAAQRWLDVEYLALPWVPGIWLLAACKHNGLRVWTPLLFIIPVITFVGHFTNYRDLFYSAPMTLVHRGPFWVLNMSRGPLSLLDNAYLLVSFLVGTWIYVSGLRNASSLFRKQALVLVLGSLLPFIGYFAFLANLSPWGLDITPVTLAVTCALLYYGIFHGGIFSLAPLARNLIFNSIRDAVLILDMQDRLLDFNPAAHALLPGLNKKSVGTELASMLVSTPGLAHALSRADESAEFATGVEGDFRSFEVRTWPLIAGTAASGTGTSGIAASGAMPSKSAPFRAGASVSRQVGRAVIFTDVTAQVLLREELQRRAETDPLTGVANRRRFHQALEVECLRYSRGRAPMSLLMIDLDFFKTVNDQYGHPVGDAVINSVAQRLMVNLRKTDVLARYGGEEFSVLLPETQVDGASVIAERIRQSVSQTPIEVEGYVIPMSVSVGVASHATDQEVSPEILLKKADLALYRAKAMGRNRVEVI